MNPVVGLGLAQIELQAMHSLQRIGLLKNEQEQQFVCHLWQGASGPAPDSTLARLALQGLVRRIQRHIGSSKYWQQTRKLCMRQSGRGKKLSRSILYSSFRLMGWATCAHSDFRRPLKCCNFNTLHFGLS